MKIKSLTLHGFKSFADKTSIELHEGLTAVVGPNGCGKSNISDALRWVLGEQRPTAIRGSRMEEAIFGGTAQRRPIHRAEVLLELNNEDGTLSVPYAEVLIGRTVHRGGESDYSLNGVSCRLRDIQDLCRDTGLGANAYAIIEGRMVDAILSDRAEERRALFEEAAEVGRYKDRRRTALRRLEQAEGDLQRLDDVLQEVRSQVRSLARQRGRAQRYVEYRDRKLQLDIAVAGVRLARAREEMAAAEEELAELRAVQPAEETRLATAEAAVERVRLEIAEREKERSAAARRLEGARRALEERERERLVAAERVAAAARRVEGIGEEEQRLALREAELEAEIAAAARVVAEEEAAAEALAAEEAELRAEVERLRSRRDEAAASEEAARSRQAEVAGETGTREAEHRAAVERIAERTAELERRKRSLEELERAEEEARRELEESRERARDAGVRAESLSREAAELRGDLEERRRRVRELRDRLGTLEGELSADRARAQSVASFIASGADLPAAVQELLEDRDAIPGVEGVLATFLQVSEEHARAVESHLGPFLYAVVVRDFGAVSAVRAWLDRREGDEGLLLLPADPGPRDDGGGDAAGTLLEVVETDGPGAGWARALLGGVRLDPDREPAPGEEAWVRPDGSGQDRLGAVRIGHPGPGRGTLGRRAELAALSQRVAEREDVLRAGGEELADLERSLEEATSAADDAERRAREAVRERQEADGRAEAAAARLERLGSERMEAEARIEELEASLEETRSGAAEAAASVEALRARRTEARDAAERARAALEEATRAWEEGRARLHDLQLRAARRKAELSAASAERRRAEAALQEVRERRDRLAAERERERRTIEAGRRTMGAGEEAVAGLLEDRRELEQALRDAEARLQEKRDELESGEAEAREARRIEREHADRRHELDLRLADLRTSETAIRERLEAEWDASLEELGRRVEPPTEGSAAEWEEELAKIRERLARIGPVNLLAEEEYEEEKGRLDFLTEQREDLEEARDDLRDSIRRINRKAAESFSETFDQIRANFSRTFASLFEGGECDVWLEDPEDPLDSPIEISASPRGKRTQRIHLLSGGERALTALALLFAIYLAKPSPFCLMDEVDAPLDEANVLRFVRMLERFKADTQFIVITHNPRTIEAADWIYGVTMQEPGVSSVVGIRFSEPAGQVA